MTSFLSATSPAPALAVLTNRSGTNFGSVPPHRFPSERLSHGIQDSLSQSPYLELQRISISLDDRSVLLIGKLSSYFLKQLAQELVRKIAYDHEIVNAILVSHAGVPEPKPR